MEKMEMIIKLSQKGTDSIGSMKQLVRYIFEPKHGIEPGNKPVTERGKKRGIERVDYSGTRNLASFEMEDICNEMARVQGKYLKLKTTKTSNTHHLIVSFKGGHRHDDKVEETKVKPPNEVIDDIVRIVAFYSDMKDRQCAYAVHDDTDHFHVHLVFNIVSFMTYTKADTFHGNFWRAKAAYEINKKYPDIMPAKGIFADKTEKLENGERYPPPAFLTELQKAWIDALHARKDMLVESAETSNNWKEFHHKLGISGLKINRVGGGLRISDSKQGKEFFLAAGEVSKKLAHLALEHRFGSFRAHISREFPPREEAMEEARLEAAKVSAHARTHETFTKIKSFEHYLRTYSIALVEILYDSKNCADLQMDLYKNFGVHLKPHSRGLVFSNGRHHLGASKLIRYFAEPFIEDRFQGTGAFCTLEVAFRRKFRRKITNKAMDEIRDSPKRLARFLARARGTTDDKAPEVGRDPKANPDYARYVDRMAAVMPLPETEYSEVRILPKDAQPTQGKAQDGGDNESAHSQDVVEQSPPRNPPRMPLLDEPQPSQTINELLAEIHTVSRGLPDHRLSTPALDTLLCEVWRQKRQNGSTLMAHTKALCGDIDRHGKLLWGSAAWDGKLLGGITVRECLVGDGAMRGHTKSQDSGSRAEIASHVQSEFAFQVANDTASDAANHTAGDSANDAAKWTADTTAQARSVLVIEMARAGLREIESDALIITETGEPHCEHRKSGERNFRMSELRLDSQMQRRYGSIASDSDSRFKLLKKPIHVRFRRHYKNLERCEGHRSAAQEVIYAAARHVESDVLCGNDTAIGTECAKLLMCVIEDEKKERALEADNVASHGNAYAGATKALAQSLETLVEPREDLKPYADIVLDVASKMPNGAVQLEPRETRHLAGMLEEHTARMKAGAAERGGVGEHASVGRLAMNPQPRLSESDIGRLDPLPVRFPRPSAADRSSLKKYASDTATQLEGSQRFHTPAQSRIYECAKSMPEYLEADKFPREAADAAQMIMHLGKYGRLDSVAGEAGDRFPDFDEDRVQGEIHESVFQAAIDVIEERDVDDFEVNHQALDDAGDNLAAAQLAMEMVVDVEGFECDQMERLGSDEFMKRAKEASDVYDATGGILDDRYNMAFYGDVTVFDDLGDFVSDDARWDSADSRARDIERAAEQRRRDEAKAADKRRRDAEEKRLRDEADAADQRQREADEEAEQSLRDEAEAEEKRLQDEAEAEEQRQHERDEAAEQSLRDEADAAEQRRLEKIRDDEQRRCNAEHKKELEAEQRREVAAEQRRESLSANLREKWDGHPLFEITLRLPRADWQQHRVEGLLQEIKPENTCADPASQLGNRSSYNSPDHFESTDQYHKIKKLIPKVAKLQIEMSNNFQLTCMSKGAYLRQRAARAYERNAANRENERGKSMGMRRDDGYGMGM